MWVYWLEIEQTTRGGRGQQVHCLGEASNEAHSLFFHVVTSSRQVIGYYLIKSGDGTVIKIVHLVVRGNE